MTIEQLKNHTEEIIEYVLLNDEKIIVTTPKGSVVIITENDYFEYFMDHFNIIYQKIKNSIKCKIVKK